jgi:hypothetical protein
MFLGLDKVREDRVFAQRLACLKPMQAVHEDKALAVAPEQDGGRLSNLQHALRYRLHGFWAKRCTALYGHIDVCDRELFAFQRYPGPILNPMATSDIRIRPVKWTSFDGSEPSEFRRL